MMIEQPTLTTPRLVLRPFSLADATVLQKLVGEKEIAENTLTIPHPYLDGMAEAWINTHAPGWQRAEQAVFAITEPNEGLIGVIDIRIKPEHKRAEVGYWIGIPFWGRGYASEALEAIIEFGFKQLDLNRIHADHFVRNPASGRVMEKAGMKYEGRFREHILKWGKFEDLATYSILRSEYHG
jgi:[ribosomal protein S5]-alanine N-acetyltransferase